MRALATVIAFSSLLAARAADGAEITDVASSFEAGNRFDFRFRLRYEHQEERAQVKRELTGLSPRQQTIQVFKDLAYSRQRDLLALRAEVGLFHDLMLSLELPIILRQQNTYAFDQSAGAACTYPPSANPTCVNAGNSSTIADGLVPVDGFDATRNGAATGPGGPLFQGALRGAAGGGGGNAFDTINLGLTWAPVSQKRDPSKPTWTVAFEPQLSIGTIKAFDRATPDANHGVSEGVHRLYFRTAISRRSRYFDPYLGFWYMLPIARDDSLFRRYSPAQKVVNPQQQAGTVFGVEAIPYEHPDKQYKFAIDLRGRIEGHFSGRGYSQMWELLAASPALDCDPAYNPSCDLRRSSNTYQNQPFTGITTIDNYATLGADIALAAQITRYLRLRLGFDYTHDQSHLITGDDIGTPVPPSTRVAAPEEFNPAYRPVVDLVGRRYRVDNVNLYSVYFSAQVMF